MLVGLTALLTGVFLTLASLFQLNAVDLLLTVFMVVIAEMMMAFGVVAMLYGWRCVAGSSPWVDATLQRLWRRAFFFAMALPAIGLVLVLSAWVAKLLVGK